MDVIKMSTNEVNSTVEPAKSTSSVEKNMFLTLN